jgi:hypothetical protein
MQSELCLPIFKGGLCVGTIDMESDVKQAFDMDLQYCHQLADLLGEYLDIIYRSSDAGWLPRLSFIHFSAHGLEKVKRKLNTRKRQKQSRSVQVDVSDLDRLKYQLSPDFIDPYRDRIETTADFLDAIKRHLKAVSQDKLPPSFFSIKGNFPRALPAKFAHSLQVILENTIENANNHDHFQGRLSLTCEPVFGNQSQFDSMPSMVIEYRSMAGRVSVGNLSALGIAPRWDEMDQTYHLGMFLIGVHVRLLGGTMWVDRQPRGNSQVRQFRFVIQVPLHQSQTERGTDHSNAARSGDV